MLNVHLPRFHLAIGIAPAAIYPPPVNILDELNWRGLVADCTDTAELTKRLAAPTTLYCGFDPTADSLHVGNLVPLLGAAPVSTARPSSHRPGRRRDRQHWRSQRQNRRAPAAHQGNPRPQHRQREGRSSPSCSTSRRKQNPARLSTTPPGPRRSAILDFLRDIGKHFSVNQMVAKESVRARMEDREVGISYTEFSYMLLQAFDFMVLCRDHDCELQIGGSDQWGNITAGIELTRKKLGQHGLRPHAPAHHQRRRHEVRQDRSPARSGSIRNAPASIASTSSGSTPTTATSSAT